MNIITPFARELWNHDPQKHIEAIGRICYKSEDKITDTSNQKFITDLRERKHWAMLEHYRFILRVPEYWYKKLMDIKMFMPNCFMRFTSDTCDGNIRYLVSASARGFMDAQDFVENSIKPKSPSPNIDIDNEHLVAILAIQKHIVAEFGCQQLFGQTGVAQSKFEVLERDAECMTDYERMVHGWHSVLFTCDRGVTHELVRHRPSSFAQESTRYCNYSLGKFGNTISVVDPVFWQEGEELYHLWLVAMANAEDSYNKMIAAGATAQQARTVLPNSTKADIVVTATNDEWKHIIDLRYLQKTGPAHPQMVEVMNSMLDHCMWAERLTVGLV